VLLGSGLEVGVFVREEDVLGELLKLIHTIRVKKEKDKWI